MRAAHIGTLCGFTGKQFIGVQLALPFVLSDAPNAFQTSTVSTFSVGLAASPASFSGVTVAAFPAVVMVLPLDFVSVTAATFPTTISNGFLPEATPLDKNIAFSLDFESGITNYGYGGQPTLVGNVATTSAQARFGTQSCVFDGTGDYFKLPTNGGFYSQDFTLEVSVRFNSFKPGLNYLFGTYDGTGSQLNTVICHTSNNLLYWSNGAISFTAGGALSTGVWYDISMTYVAATSMCYLFINGVLVGSAVQAVTNGSAPMYFGGSPTNTAWCFDGWMDNVRMTAGQALATDNYKRPAAAFAAPAAPSDLVNGRTTNIWAALSIQKLFAASTTSIRVRRSSDNAEQDIGFSGGVLDTVALLAFAAGSSCYVVKIYDQHGVNDVVQVTATKQARIVNDGVYDGKLVFDGVDDCYVSANNSSAGVAKVSFLLKGNLRSFATTEVMVELGASTGSSANNEFVYYCSSNTTKTTIAVSMAANYTNQLFGPGLANSVQSVIIDRTQPQATQGRVWDHGTQLNPSTTSLVGGTLPSGSFTPAKWNVGARNNGASLPAPLDFDTLLIYEGALSPTDNSALSVALG